jgi:ribosomal protein L24
MLAIMNNFQKNDRVFVKRGKYSNKNGRVKDGTPLVRGLRNCMSVVLDNLGEQEIFVGEIEYENLTPSQLAAEIQDIKKKIELENQLREEKKKELLTHLEKLRNAIASHDKPNSICEFNYVQDKLKIAVQKGYVTKEWMKTIGINLEKIDWAVKRLS